MRLRSIEIVLLIFWAVLLTSCSSGKVAYEKGDYRSNSARPAWLDDPGSLYNDEVYITAIGQGFSRSDAEQDAAGKLARIFRSEVETSEITELRYEELTKGLATTSEDYARVTKNIELSAQEELINIQFGESYTDNMGRVFVIAYLHRYRTAQIYEEMVSANSEKVVYFYKKNEPKENALEKYAYLSAAWTIARKNEDLIRQMKIISPQMSDLIQLDYDMNQLQEAFNSSAKNISFGILIEDDYERKTTSMIKQLITEKGFRFVDEEPFLEFKGKTQIEKTDLQRDDGTIFFRWHLNLDLLDNRGEVLLSLNLQGRSGSVSETEAKSRVYRDINKNLKQELPRKLEQTFDQIALKDK